MKQKMKIFNLTIVTLLLVFSLGYLLSGCGSKQDQQQQAKPTVSQNPPQSQPEQPSQDTAQPSSTTTETNEQRMVEEEIATIERLEHELIESYRNGDTKKLQSLMDDDYSIGLPNGRGFGTKNTEINGIKGPLPAGFILQNDSLQILVRGSMALVNKLLIQKGKAGGKNVDSKSVWTDLWVKNDTRWQILSSHGTYLAVDSYVY